MALLPGGLARADILISGGRIEKIGAGLPEAGAEMRDVTGMVISPGFIDLHAHLREPGFAYKETIRTGTMAAVAGGYTLVCAMPNLNPVPDCMEALTAELELIRGGALIHVLPYGAITKGEGGCELADLRGMLPYCAGFSDDGKGVQDAGIMEAAMRALATLGGLLAAHCEDNALAAGGCVHAGAAARLGLAAIPSEAEWRQAARDIALVRKTGARYHICHVSAKETVALVRNAQREGLPVTCECTPHQLMLCDEDVIADDGRYKMNPPLRGREDRDAITEGLLDGTIACIATDHAPHSAAEKSKGFAESSFGVVGLETAFAACHTALVKSGRMRLDILLGMFTTGPAGLLGRASALAPGMDADITVIDTARMWKVDAGAFYSMGRSTPFAGMELTGKVLSTYCGGRLVYHEGKIV
jgi:dihydroorotase